MTRICRTCLIEQPLNCFLKRKNTDRHYWKCNSCNSKISAKWGKTNTLKRLITMARYRAKKASLPCLVMHQWILDNIGDKCPCCMTQFRMGDANGRGKIMQNRPSLDRVNPKMGYTAMNTRIICHKCNRIKNSGSLEEHEAIARWLSRGAPREYDFQHSDGDGI